MTTTVRIKASQIYKDWHVIDAAGRPLGRVATEAATLLRGKHKPTYEPHLDDGDFVIVVNASKVRVSGRKSEQIKYYTHSGYPGGLKTRTYERQLELFPERILEQAIKGMLPGGPLGKAIARHLKVYKGPEHPHASQIAGSEKAREARAAAPNPFARPATPPRLRPLSIPQEQAQAEAEEQPPTATATDAKETAPKRSRKAQAAPAAEEPKEAPKATRAASKRAATDAPEATAPAVEAAEDASSPDHAVDVEPAAEETPKKRAPRKKAESTAKPSAKATTKEEPKKPARRRAAKQEE
jgi:large subunit ribosomal protein L13